MAIGTPSSGRTDRRVERMTDCRGTVTLSDYSRRDRHAACVIDNSRKVLPPPAAAADGQGGPAGSTGRLPRQMSAALPWVES
jgi:hypothetical protein